MFDDDPFDGFDFEGTADADTPDRDESGGLLHEAILEMQGLDNEQAFDHLEEVMEIELQRMEDGPEKQMLEKQYNEVFQNNVTHEPNFCEDDDAPDHTDFGVQLSPELPADRVLSMTQRATVRGAIRRMVSLPATTRPVEEGVIGVDGVGTVHIAYSDLNLTITVEARHDDAVGMLTTASVIECDDHPTGERHSDDLSSLGELGGQAAQLEADLIETGLMMLQGTETNPATADSTTEDVTPVGDRWMFPFGRSFDSMTCNGRLVTFELTLSVKQDINRIYNDEMVDEAQRYGIPLEPTMEEREAHGADRQ